MPLLGMRNSNTKLGHTDEAFESTFVAFCGILCILVSDAGNGCDVTDAVDTPLDTKAAQILFKKGNHEGNRLPREASVGNFNFCFQLLR